MYDFTIVDEASMLDVDVFTALTMTVEQLALRLFLATATEAGCPSRVRVKMRTLFVNVVSLSSTLVSACVRMLPNCRCSLCMVYPACAW